MQKNENYKIIRKLYSVYTNIKMKINFQKYKNIFLNFHQEDINLTYIYLSFRYNKFLFTIISILSYSILSLCSSRILLQNSKTYIHHLVDMLQEVLIIHQKN